MNRVFVILYFACFIFSTCNNKYKTNENIASHTESQIPIYLFKDSSIVIHLEKSGTDSIALSLINTKNDKFRPILKDVLYSSNLSYDTADFNSDNALDLLILREVNQSNPSYYLYLTNRVNSTIRKVDGFELLNTPTFDKKNNIIISYLRSGNQFLYSFFRLEEDSLIDLNESFSIDNLSKFDSSYAKIIEKLKL